MSEQKAAAPSTDLFARKGGAKPAGQLIPFESKAEALKRALAEKAADDGPEATKTDGGPCSLLTVIELRKPTPGQEAGAAPAGKSISELSEAVSEVFAEPPGAETATAAKPADSEPPEAAQAAPSDDTKPSSAAESKPASEAEPAGAGQPKPEQAPSSGGAKIPPAFRAAPTPFGHTVPKAPPLGQRPPREHSRGGLALVLLVATGLTMAAWLATKESWQGPAQDPASGAAQPLAPAAGTEGAPESGPAGEAGAPETAGAPAAHSPAASAEAPTPAVVEPSFDLIRIEPDGEAVIAGRAAPGAELILLDNGEPIGRVTADLAGEWAFIPDAPLLPEDHQFSLVIAKPQGTVNMPAPKAAEEKATEEPQEPQGTGAPAAEPTGQDNGVLPDGGIGKQSWLLEPEAETPPLPTRRPAFELVAVGAEASVVKAGYFVQLSSVISLDGAWQEREKLQRIFPQLLGGMELAVEEAKLDDWSTRYRVRAGRFAEREPARALCRELRARRQDCLVVKQ